MSSPAFLRVPGLYLFANFLSSPLQSSTLKHLKETQEIIRLKAQESLKVKARSYLSQQHNLQTEEFYRKVELIPPGETQKISLQYFEKYGSDGHELTYGIGEENISSFMLRNFFPAIETLPPVISLRQSLKEGQALKLRQTTNIYNSVKKASLELPGFDWHTDTEENGDITAICTLEGEPVNFELKKKNNPQETFSLTFAEKSVLILSGEARWDWLHRIVPTQSTNSSSTERRRISVALGYKKWGVEKNSAKPSKFDLTPDGLFPDKNGASEDKKCLIISKVFQEMMSSVDFSKVTQEILRKDAQLRYEYLSKEERLPLYQADHQAFLLYQKGVEQTTAKEYISFRLSEHDKSRWIIITTPEPIPPPASKL